MIIGIDMGTTNSAVAVVEDEGDARVLGPPGHATIPSIIHFDGEGFTVGARLAGGADAANSFSGIKRLLGRKAHSEEVEHLAQTVPYRIAASPTGDCWVRVGDRPTSPQELAGALLRALRVRAEDELKQPITRAVLAVPAYFDDSQRQAVRDAGHVAGLEVVRLINEPTAAALAYGMARAAKGSKTVAVFDLGGGTFDVSILRVENDVFSVLASHGDASLGGDDWDRRIFDLLSDELFSEHRFDATSSAPALVALREASEKAKIDLTSKTSTEISIVIEQATGGAPLRIERVLTRDELESETADLCDRLAAPCRLALRDAEVGRSELDEVLLVGGMTHVPMIQRAVRELLGEPSSGQLDPSTAVARGAAICAAIIDGSDSPTTLLDVSSHSVGVRVGDIELPRAIARGQELPARRMIRLEVPGQLVAGLTVELFRGESDDLEDDTLVGRVLLELGNVAGEETEPRELELTISIDVNSIVSVEAFDVATGTVAKSRLRTRGALSQSQLVRIVGDGDDLAFGVVAGGD